MSYSYIALKKKTTPYMNLLSLGFLILLLSACLGPQNKMDQNTQTVKYEIEKVIHIPLFFNATLEPILEKKLTQIFKETFYTQGWEIHNKHMGTEKTLTGKIKVFSVTPSALNPKGGARAYQMKIQMEVQVQGEKEGVILKTNLEGTSEYTARPDSAADRAAKNRAIREAAREMAERTTAFLEMPLSQQK